MWLRVRDGNPKLAAVMGGKGLRQPNPNGGACIQATLDLHGAAALINHHPDHC
jgi:hypothetical protein